MELSIPPEFQLLSALVIGVLVAVGAAYKFFSDLKRSSARDDPADQLRVLVAPISDKALDGVSKELREIRAVMERALAGDRTADLARAVDRLIEVMTRSSRSRSAARQAKASRPRE